MTAIARRLVSEPDVRGLTPRERSQVANWRLPAASAPAFSVFEKTVEQIQDAMARGLTTSEDVVREYLTRLSAYDRSGPTFRSFLALNRRAVADARALDAERAARTDARPVPRHPDRVQGQHRRLRPADHRRVVRAREPPAAARLEDGRRHARAAARSCSARRTSTSFRSATSASARSRARSATPTIPRSARPDRAAAAPSRCRRAWSRWPSGPTRAIRCRTRRRSRGWRPSARRGG